MGAGQFPVVFDEVGYYAVSGMDKMLAMGRGLGFMFYLGFQELPGLKARIGECMYSLLGNANLQILMKLQEGSETRQYVERTAGGGGAHSPDEVDTGPVLAAMMEGFRKERVLKRPSLSASRQPSWRL